MADTSRKPNQAFLTDDAVYLRPMEPEDLDIVRSWTNSPDIRASIGSVFPQSRAAALKWLENVEQDKERVWFAIVEHAHDKVVGETGLLRISYPWRCADCSMIIGDEAARGRGLGTQAARLLIDYAFGSLSLNRLSVWVASTNQSALAWWRSLGFKDEGVAREAYFLDGRYHDFIMLGLLAREWDSHER